MPLRAADAILHWRARHLSLTALTGQVGSVTRAGVAWGSDTAGRPSRRVTNSPRWHWHTDPVTGLVVPGLYLEGARTNVITNPIDITAANGWTVSGATTTNYYRYGDLSFTRLANATAADTTRNITLTGSGTKVFTWHVHFDVTGTQQLLVWDATAAATIVGTRVNWAADKSATLTNTVGTLLEFVRLGEGVYRVRLAGTYTAGNTTSFRPTTSSGTTCATVQVTAVMAEDAATASSFCEGTRPAESFTLPFLAPPRSMTAYMNFIDLLGADTATLSGLVFGTASGTLPTAQLYRTAGKWVGYHVNGSTSTSTAAASPAVGNEVECLVQWASDGKATIGQALNQGATAMAAAGGAVPFATAWNGSPVTLQVAHAAGALQSQIIVRSILVMRDICSMDDMAEAAL